MSAVNPNWHRWVYASFSKHMHTGATAAGLELVVEFTDGRSAAWKAATTNAEATITGPMTKERSPGEHRIWVDVFVVVTSDRTNNDYDHIDLVGAMANNLDQCILVMDYGDTGLVEVGQMFPRRDEGDSVDVTHIKPKETDDQIFSTLAVRFEGTFTE